MNCKHMVICLFILISILLMGGCKENTVQFDNAKNSAKDALGQYDLNKVVAIRLFTMGYEHGDSLIEYAQINTHSGGSIVESDVYSSLANIVTVYGDDAKNILKTAEYNKGVAFHQSSRFGNIIFDDASSIDITVFNGDQGFKINDTEGYYGINMRDPMGGADSIDETQLLAYNKLILPEITPEAIEFSFDNDISWSAPYSKGEITVQDLFEVTAFMYEENMKLLRYGINTAGGLSLLYEHDLYDGVFIKWNAQLNTITELIYLRH